MNNPQLNELINAAVDGELDQSGQAELERLLDESEAARAKFEDMQKLVAFLGRLPDVEPPADLRRQILANAELPKPQRRWLGILDVWTNFGRAVPRTAQLGVSFAMGAVLAAGVLSLVTSIPGDMPARQLVGTMAPDAADEPAGLVSIDTAAVSGFATLQAVDGIWTASFDLESPGSDQVDVRVSNQNEQPLRVSFAGKRRFSLEISPDEGPIPAPVRFEISQNGQEIFSGRLEAVR